MSDRDPNNEPLFQNMDEQERIYAPEEVPGEQIPPGERDYGEGSGESVAEAQRADEGGGPGVGVVLGAGGVTGASGGSAGVSGVVPLVPIREEVDPDERREMQHQDDDRERD